MWTQVMYNNRNDDKVADNEHIEDYKNMRCRFVWV